jgi:spermidine synthase
MSKELRDINGMVYRTLGQAFAYIRPIPGDLTLWLGSSSDVLVTAPMGVLLDRWEGRGLETQLMTGSHIRLKLNQRRLDWFLTALGGPDGAETALSAPVGPEVNRDLRPVGLFYGLSYWNALFSPQVARALAFAGRLNLWRLVLLIGACGLLGFVIVKRTARGKRAVVPVVIVATGFAGMTADLLIIFAFQTLYGYVYQWIGLLIAAFMVGLSLGSLLMTRKLADIRRARATLLKLELALVLYWALLPVALGALYARINAPLMFLSIHGILLLLGALAGFLVGAQFPLANRLWLKDRGDRRGTAGLLYACDLVGAFLGSIVVSVFLVPVLGILETCLLVAMIKFISLLLVVTSSPPGQGKA